MVAKNGLPLSEEPFKGYSHSSPSEQISMSHVSFLSYFPCTCFSCSYLPLAPSLPYRVLIFFIIRTVDVSYHSKLSLSHSGTAHLSLLAHLFLPPPFLSFLPLPVAHRKEVGPKARIAAASTVELWSVCIHELALWNYTPVQSKKSST